MSVINKIKELRKKYPQYAYMKYAVEANKEKGISGDNWLVGSFGQSYNDNKYYYLTTDHIHCSENVGTAETDTNLICELLNIFCNEEK